MTEPIVPLLAVIGLLVIVVILIACFRNPSAQIKLTVPLVKYEGPMIGMLPVSVLGLLLIGLVLWSPKPQELVTLVENGWHYIVPQ